MKLSTNFSTDERNICCPHCRCFRFTKQSERQVRMIQKLRDKVGMPLSVNSWYRCKEHNAKVGGAKASKHLLGIATDIRARRGSLRRKLIVAAAKKIGFKGIGYYKTFVHLDSRPTRATWKGGY